MSPLLRRTKAVQLDNGGWVDLNKCELLWGRVPGFLADNMLVLTLTGRNPAPAVIRRRVDARGLFRTDQGNYIVKEPIASGGFGGPIPRWRQVDKEEAYGLLMQFSPQRAARYFPEEHSRRVGER
jgi:hypothetical protein